MVTGKEGVGKTCLVNTLLERTFNEEEPSTDGIVLTTAFQTTDISSVWKEAEDMDECERIKDILDNALESKVAEKLKQMRSQAEAAEPVQASAGKSTPVPLLVHAPKKESRSKPGTSSTPILPSVPVPVKVNEPSQALPSERQKRIIDRMIGKASASTSNEDMTYIWDFAGQQLYYITHRVSFEVPEAILARGSEALKVFNEELQEGRITVNHARLMVTGKEGVGKTCLVNTLLERTFNEEEPSTDGIVLTTAFQTTDISSVWKKAEDMDECERIKDILDIALESKVAEKLKQMRSQAEAAEPVQASAGKSTPVPPLVHAPKKESRSKPGTSSTPILPSVPVPVKRKVSDPSQAQLPSERQKRIIDRMIGKASASTSNEDMTYIWDFAGQQLYYITHRIFLTSEAVYLILFNLMEGMHDKGKCRVSRMVKQDVMTYDMTNVQIIKYWMRLIYTYAVPVESQAQATLQAKKPQIVLVGTHSESLQGTAEDKKKKIEEQFGIIFEEIEVITNPRKLIDILKKIITVVEPDDSDKWASMIKLWEKLDNEGILEEELVRHLWRDEISKDESSFEVFLELMKQFGLLCEQIKHQASKYRSFFVPCRLKRSKDNVSIEPDTAQMVSIYMASKDFIPDSVFHPLVVSLIGMVQDMGYPAMLELFSKYADISLGLEHTLSLGPVVINNKPSLKLEISRMPIIHEDNTKTSTGEPSPRICMQVLEFLKKEMEVLTSGMKHTRYKFRVLCWTGLREMHFHDLEECLENAYIRCSKKLATTAKLQRMFKNKQLVTDSSMPAAGSSDAETAPPDERLGYLEDRHLLRIAKGMGMEWKQLGVRLGLSWKMIQQIWSDNRRLFDSIMDMLTEWRKQQNYEKNQVQIMCRALKEQGLTELANKIFGSQMSEVKEANANAGEDTREYNDICMREEEEKEQSELLVSQARGHQYVKQSKHTASEGSHSSIDLQPMKEMSERQFRVLKMVVSNWYTENKCLTMLKVLFRDMVDNMKLAVRTNTIDLINELVTQGKMSAKDPTLLYDTISITGHNIALQTKIKEKLPSFQDVEGGTVSTNFTAHRQKLMKLGKNLKQADVMAIDGLYNTPRKTYEDSWSMITDLEDRLEISEGNMDEFIESLKILELPLALKALTD
ncbi:uncharacterized protein LOC117112287 [Anneissia japonica]|uniref:uncharacterized protein LOC117112287 n=1 Tax=Anneissia japonica TaxID=1529436 RepID=UPI0014256150|nr:uncharacterized protein LOC117112287 [Anneissia japonica]